MDRYYATEVVNPLTDYTIVVVRAPPGKGKSLVAPETALSWADGASAGSPRRCGKAVLLAEPSRFVSEMLVEGSQKCRTSPREIIQLITGDNTEDQFKDGRTELVITTHGMLRKWITSG